MLTDELTKKRRWIQNRKFINLYILYKELHFLYL